MIPTPHQLWLIISSDIWCLLISSENWCLLIISYVWCLLFSNVSVCWICKDCSSDFVVSPYFYKIVNTTADVVTCEHFKMWNRGGVCVWRGLGMSRLSSGQLCGCLWMFNDWSSFTNVRHNNCQQHLLRHILHSYPAVPGLFLKLWHWTILSWLGSFCSSVFTLTRR